MDGRKTLCPMHVQQSCEKYGDQGDMMMIHNVYSYNVEDWWRLNKISQTQSLQLLSRLQNLKIMVREPTFKLQVTFL